jgi:hypothetical protein
VNGHEAEVIMKAREYLPLLASSKIIPIGRNFIRSSYQIFSKNLSLQPQPQRQQFSGQRKSVKHAVAPVIGYALKLREVLGDDVAGNVRGHSANVPHVSHFCHGVLGNGFAVCFVSREKAL